MGFIQASHRAARLAAVTVALSVASVAANAQSQTAQPQPNPASLAVAKELVNVTGATALFNPLIAGVVEQAKILFLQQNPALGKDLNDIAAKIRTDLAPRFGEITDEVARLYATHFTEQELKDILAFYKSPSGQKLLHEQPKVVDGSMKFAQNWANSLSDLVMARMRDELKKRGDAP